MSKRPQTQSRRNVSTIMTKLNSAGRQNLDELRNLTEAILELPVSNAVVIQRALQMYRDEFARQLEVAHKHAENGLIAISSWIASERLNLIKAAEGSTT